MGDARLVPVVNEILTNVGGTLISTEKKNNMGDARILKGLQGIRDNMGTGGGGGTSVIVEDNLTSTSTINALSANQGRVLNEKIDSNEIIVEDVLTSTSIENALSANQGMVLDGRISNRQTGTITLNPGLTNQGLTCFYQTIKNIKHISVYGNITLTKQFEVDEELFNLPFQSQGNASLDLIPDFITKIQYKIEYNPNWHVISKDTIPIGTQLCFGFNRYF